MADYVTTFCNFPHEVSTGKPVRHTCYVLPVKALEAEVAGDFDRANEILRETRLARVLHGDRRVKK
jgi:hypothetical protein